MEVINNNVGTTLAVGVVIGGAYVYHTNTRMNGFDQEMKKINETTTKLQGAVEKTLVSKKEFEALKNYMGETIQRLSAENAELRERLGLLMDRDQNSNSSRDFQSTRRGRSPLRREHLPSSSRREQEFHLASYRDSGSTKSSSRTPMADDSGLLELAPRSKERGR